MMEHQQVLELLPAYVDQELGVTGTTPIECHLHGCAACQREYAQQSQLSAQLKNPAFYFEAPAGLARRINAALPKDRSAAADAKRWDFNFSWLNAGAALATLLAAVWSAGLYLTLPSAQDRLTDEVVASHVRSLQVDHLSDVISTDRHTVKPWFNGKLNFSPTVIDLAAQGYPLIGGRLDYLDGHPVAALIYRHQQHPINLYVWPNSDSNAAPLSQSQRGYHLAHWSVGGMTYWVVSDVAAPELATFAALLRTQLSQAG
jgi:anti-sigma factor RsiW